MPADGLVLNLLSFNVGVECGQLIGLAAVLLALAFWRRHPSFQRQAYNANVIVMTAGLVLMGMQLAGLFLSRS